MPGSGARTERTSKRTCRHPPGETDAFASRPEGRVFWRRRAPDARLASAASAVAAPVACRNTRRMPDTALRNGKRSDMQSRPWSRDRWPHNRDAARGFLAEPARRPQLCETLQRVGDHHRQWSGGVVPRSPRPALALAGSRTGAAPGDGAATVSSPPIAASVHPVSITCRPGRGRALAHERSFDRTPDRSLR